MGLFMDIGGGIIMLGELESLMQIDFVRFVMDVFIILVGIVTIGNIISKFSEMIGKPIGWVKRRSEDHELISKTVADLNNFREKYITRGLKVEEEVEKLQRVQADVKDTLHDMSKKDDVLGDEISSLIIANRETLGDRIDERFRYYFQIGGIPEDEYEGFISLHDAYKLVGGNHIRDEKYDYAMKKFPILKKGYTTEGDSNELG